MNIKVLASSPRDALKVYLRSLSSTLPPPFKELAPTEIDLLAEFILLPDKYHWARFSSPAKNRVVQEFSQHSGPLTRANLNNKLYSIYSKGYLKKDEDRVWYINKNILQAASKVVKEYSTNGSFTYTFSIVAQKSEGTDSSSSTTT